MHNYPRPAKRYPDFLEVLREEQKRVTKELKALILKREIYEAVATYLNECNLPNEQRIDFFDSSIGIYMVAIPTQSVACDFEPLMAGFTTLFERRKWRTGDECSSNHGGLNKQLYYRWTLNIAENCDVFISIRAETLADAEWQREETGYSGTNVRYILKRLGLRS